MIKKISSEAAASAEVRRAVFGTLNLCAIREQSVVKGASRCTGRAGEETVFNTLLRLLFIELTLMHCYNARTS